MKVVIQRVLSASVTVDSQVVSSIGKGMLVLAAVSRHDSVAEVKSMAQKLLKVKMWDDASGGRWKQNIKDIDGEILLVSQFTLYAKLQKGAKPDFHNSAGPEMANELYSELVDTVKELHHPDKVKDGVFGAMMQVALVNDGPVTFELEVAPGTLPPPKPEKFKAGEKKTVTIREKSKNSDGKVEAATSSKDSEGGKEVGPDEAGKDI